MPVAGAVPQTAAEQERYARMVAAAEAMLAQDGEQGLQMKHLAQRADVALATLYRYFPSKDHVIGAIALERHRRALARLDARRFEGATAGERVGDMLVRQFRAVTREPGTAAALQRAANTVDRAASEYVEGIVAALLQMARAAIAVDGNAVTPEQELLLPIVLAAANGATANWLSGILSADGARAQTRTAARLLDLPPAIVRDVMFPTD